MTQTPAPITIRLIEPDEIAFVAEQRLAAYSQFDIPLEYRDDIADVARQAEIGEVWVAVDDATGAILGSVITPKAGQAISSLARPGELDFRLLAVDQQARGRGVGSLLTEFVIDLGRQRGVERVVMNSTSEMVDAHRIYERRGFVRLPDRETPGVEPARAYGLDL